MPQIAASHTAVGTDAIEYESVVLRDPGYAMAETGRFFESDSAVHRTLRRLAARLEALDVPYAVCGGMALSAHGYLRATEDVDVLVTAASLERIHERLIGLGYRPAFAGSRHLRDTQDRVKVEFLIAGGYPGDGKEKPVSFPDPAGVNIEHDGVHYVGLSTLIELKLASGMTNAGRLKDLADVQELIRHVGLERGFAEELHEYVRGKYLELWHAVSDDATNDVH